MIRYTRQEAKQLGFPTCYGALCKKHPELEGHRRVSGACVECSREQTRKYRAADPERTLAHRTKNNAKVTEKRKTDPEMRAKKLAYDKWYRAANPEKVAEIKRAWAAKNPGATSAAAKLRKWAQKQRTPKWLTKDDLWLIREAYALASLRTKMLGIQYEVDHCVPLQGETVSGLHVPNNLQVIPRLLNRAKWNHFEAA